MTDLENALEDCVIRLARGETTPAECLALYPEHAAELEPMLGIMARLEQARTVRPSAAFKARARADLIAHMRANPHGTRAHRAGVVPLLLRFAFALAALGLLLTVSGTALAQAALPGDVLYGWKISSEQVWRAVHPDRVAADLVLANRRTDELVRVAGNVQAETIAQREYQRVIDDLPRNPDPSSKTRIQNELGKQQIQLQKVGVHVPALATALSVPPTREPPATTATRTPAAPASQAVPSGTVVPGVGSTPSPSIVLPSATPSPTFPAPSKTPFPPTRPSAAPTLCPTASPTWTPTVPRMPIAAPALGFSPTVVGCETPTPTPLPSAQPKATQTSFPLPTPGISPTPVPPGADPSVTPRHPS